MKKGHVTDEYLEKYVEKSKDWREVARIKRTLEGHSADLCDHVLHVDFKYLNELRPFRVVIYYKEEFTSVIERWCKTNRDFVKGTFFRDKNNRLSFFYSE